MKGGDEEVVAKKFPQVFGERTAGEEAQEVDILYSESVVDRKLFEKVKDITWLIEICYFDKGKRFDFSGTGFSVSEDGLIMTCDHLFCLPGTPVSIEARNHTEDIFRRVETKLRYPALDVAILQVVDHVSCKSGQFASCHSLYPGQPLASVGYPGRHPGTFVVGRSSTHCVDLDADSLRYLLKDKNTTCDRYESRELFIPSQWKIMGHYFNREFFSFMSGSDFDKNMNPLVPVVVSCGLAFPSGSSGSPLFKSDGTIIGMVVRTDLSIHVSLLEACLEDYKSVNFSTLLRS